MAGEPDFFDRIPKEWSGLVIAGLGALLLVGALCRWKWVLDMTGQKSARPFGLLTLLHDLFGDEGVRIGTIVLSAIVVISGFAMFFLMR